MKSMEEKATIKKLRIQFGKYLSFLRYEKHFSVMDVAKGTGMSDPYLYQVENGVKALTDPINFRKLADFFKIPVEDLLKKAGYLPDEDPYKEINEKYELILKTSHLKLPFPKVATIEHKMNLIEMHKTMEEKQHREK